MVVLAPVRADWFDRWAGGKIKNRGAEYATVKQACKRSCRMPTACALHCTCTCTVLHVHCICTACLLHAYCMHTACAAHAARLLVALQAWKELLLQRLYEHLPQLKGHVAYADVGTPLSNDFYLGSVRACTCMHCAHECTVHMHALCTCMCTGACALGQGAPSLRQSGPRVRP